MDNGDGARAYKRLKSVIVPMKQEQKRDNPQSMNNQSTLKSLVVIPSHSTFRHQVNRDVLEQHKGDYINIVMLGHSYVSRLRWNQLQYMKISRESMAEAVNLNDTGINPFFYGRGGVTLKNIPLFVKITQYHYPHVLVLEVGQNDLCSMSCNPEKLAEQLYTEILIMFECYEFLELVVVCEPLRKWDTGRMKGDKPIDMLNVDITIFNYEFLQLTRNDKRIVRWCHRGLTTLTPLTSTDGTHPNTIGGYWRYLKSVSNAFKIGRKEMFLRRGRSIWAIVKRKKAINKARTARRQRNKLLKEPIPHYD